MQASQRTKYAFCLTWFDLGFFDFTMVPKKKKISRNHTHVHLPFVIVVVSSYTTILFFTFSTVFNKLNAFIINKLYVR